jgi:hypothetical protein
MPNDPDPKVSRTLYVLVRVSLRGGLCHVAIRALENAKQEQTVIHAVATLRRCDGIDAERPRHSTLYMRLLHRDFLCPQCVPNPFLAASLIR